MENFKFKEKIEADKFEEFFQKEERLIEGAGGFLIDLAPDKYKKKTTAMLAAFSLFIGASTIFAKGASAEEIEKAEFSPVEEIEEISEENKISNFDWEKMVGKIELSAGTKSEESKEFHQEVVDNGGYEAVKKSEFYKGITAKNYNEVAALESKAIYNSKNFGEFLKNFSANQEGFDDRQKALILQRLGALLDKTYNNDMLNAGETVEISDDAMFNAVKTLYQTGKIEETGICGNIHTFLTKTAKSLGMDAWLQSGSLEEINHVWSGFIAESGGKKQIVFLNYGSLVPTGTLNYKDAIGIWERHQKSIATFISYVGDENKVLFPAKSRAQEVIEKTAGFEESGMRLEEELKTGKLKKEKGLEISLSPEIKEFKFTKDTVGLAFLNYQNIHNNPYQSLEDLNALRGRVSSNKREHFGLESDITIIHGNVKDLYGGQSAFNEFIGRLAADYVNGKEMSKSEYGKFVLNYGATLQAGIRLPLDKEIKLSNIGGMGEGAIGARLIYLDPENIGKFYIGASEVFRGQINDFQNQDFMVKEAAKSLVVGSEVKVFEGKIMNLEAQNSQFDWGKSFGIKGGLAGEKLKGKIGYEKKSSEYERFIPSSEKIEVGVSYKSGPKWEIDVIGAKTTEKYKDAESKDTYNAEIKLRIFLW